MNKLFSWQTILLTLIGMGMVNGLPANFLSQDNVNLDRSNNINWVNDYGSVGSDYDYDPDRSADNWQKIVGLTGLALGSGAIAYRLIKENRVTKISNLPSLNEINRGKVSLVDSISPKLRRELLRLVSNPQTANRLLSGTLISHAGRSPNWAAEKVIYDLKRDRA